MLRAIKQWHTGSNNFKLNKMFIYSMKSKWKATFRIVLLYFLLGIIWIWVSDRIRLPGITDEHTMLVFQTVKGFLYVLITAILLYVLIYQYVRRQDDLIKLLRENNSLLRLGLAHYSGLNILLLDKDQKIIQAFGQDLLWDKHKTGDIVGGSVVDLVDEHDDKHALQAFLKAAVAKQEHSDIRNIHGQWYRLKMVTMPSNNGKSELKLLVIENFTVEKQLKDEREEYLKQNEELAQKLKADTTTLRIQQIKFREVIDSISEGIIIRSLTPQGKPGMMENINKSALHLLNLNNKEIRPEDLWLNFEADNSDDLSKYLQNDFRSNQLFTIRGKLKNLDTDNKVEVNCKYVDCGSHSYVMAFITPPNSASVPSLQKSIEVFSLLEAVHVGIVLFDKDFLCYYCNSGMRSMLGKKDMAARSYTLEELFGGIVDVDFEMLLKDAFNGESQQSPDFKFPGRGAYWYCFIFYPVRNEKGLVETVMGVSQDNTLRRAYEETLFDDISLTEKSDNLKSVFLSNLSHEVRTPMNGILGFVELLEQDELSGSQKYFLNLIRKSCDNLLCILGSLLDMSKIENGQIAVEKKWVNIDSIVTEVSAFLNKRLIESAKENVEARIYFHPEQLPFKIYSDEFKIFEILKILIDNAVKFTQNGFIEFGVGRNNSDRFLSFWVNDTGIGIADPFKQLIFQPFQTFNDSDKLIYGGLGLGLSIAKGLADAMSAEIEVDSEKGQGSRFVLSVPLQLGEDDEADKEDFNEAGKARKVLIVQYGYSTIKEVIKQLRQHNVHVVHANDGVSAIEKFFENKDVDLIITDVRLSDMSSFELIRALRRINENIPVIAQTAYYLADEKQRCLNEGFVDYLLKPFEPSTIIRLLRKL